MKLSVSLKLARQNATRCAYDTKDFCQCPFLDVFQLISHFRSLGKTLVVKVCVKKTVSQLEKDKRTPAQAIQDDLNDQVRYPKRYRMLNQQERQGFTNYRQH